MYFNKISRRVMAFVTVTAFILLLPQHGIAQDNPLAVPLVALNSRGVYSADRCSTTHDVLDVQFHEGEYCIDTVRIYADGFLMQSVPIREDDAITHKIVHFLDVNFDGYVDILVGPGRNREYSTIIMWDSEENKFVRATNDGFTVFNGEFYYDPKRMVVYRMTSSSAFETTYTLMVWQGSDLQSEETFLQVADPSYYDSYRVNHRYTVRNYYSDEDVISTDNPEEITEPWDKWLVSPYDDD